MIYLTKDEKIGNIWHPVKINLMAGEYYCPFADTHFDVEVDTEGAITIVDYTIDADDYVHVENIMEHEEVEDALEEKDDEIREMQDRIDDLDNECEVLTNQLKVAEDKVAELQAQIDFMERNQ